MISMAILLAAFGIWGIFTKEGRRQFDELSGMIPLTSLTISFLLASACLLYTIYS